MQTITRTPYKVSVEEYRAFRRDGFLVVRGLVPTEEVDELRAHTEDLIYGRVDVPGIPPVAPGTPVEEVEKRLLRVHMLHRALEIHERFLLHPRILDVLEAIIGPDVAAMQTMLFLKAPGANGQGFHQDSYYIPTFPDTLCGAWLAIDRADQENGCLWMRPGSQHEPIYPPVSGYGYGERVLKDIPAVANVGGHSNDDADPLNGLKPVAAPYPEVPVELDPGDVAFFGGHVLHRSLSNKTKDRMRRSFVGHYCNARSFTTWDGGNQMHILARGNTNLPYAKPKFGTPCAALDPRPSAADLSLSMMMGMPDGSMEAHVPGQESDDH